jgi:hypothetical protein
VIIAEGAKVPGRAGLPSSLLPKMRRNPGARTMRPVTLPDHPAAPPRTETETPVLEEIHALIEAYEIDIHCSRCTTILQRSISWLHKRYMMNCPECRAVIVLRTSIMTDEIRRVSRQLKDLQLQLLESVGKANSILGR